MEITDKILTKVRVNTTSTEVYCKRDIIITPEEVAKFLLKIVALLTVAHIIGSYFKRMPFEQTVFTRTFSRFFDLVGENNVPAVFSFLLLLFASALLAYIAFATIQKSDKKYWIGLSTIFVFLSLDELLTIHESVDKYISANHFDNTLGLSAYVWVVPYFIASVFVGALFLRFTLYLPKTTRNLFFLTGFLYVFAAIGIDSIQGFIQMYNINHLYYWMLTTIEEPLEMSSIIVFIYALLSYISPNNGNIYIGTR